MVTGQMPEIGLAACNAVAFALCRVCHDIKSDSVGDKPYTDCSVVSFTVRGLSPQQRYAITDCCDSLRGNSYVEFVVVKIGNILRPNALSIVICFL